MRENIATIPLIDAFKADGECPFCHLEREAEQHAISFILGSAYMEDDIREKTDATGFCRHHFKMMYDYGNRLGNALILSTHLKKLNAELTKEMKDFSPGKSSFLKRMRKTDATDPKLPETQLGSWISQKVNSCYANFALFSCKFFKFVYPVQTSSYKTLLSSSQLRHQKSYKPNFLARKSACAFLNTKALRICLRIACSAASPS